MLFFIFLKTQSKCKQMITASCVNLLETFLQITFLKYLTNYCSFTLKTDKSENFKVCRQDVHCQSLNPQKFLKTFGFVNVTT